MSEPLDMKRLTRLARVLGASAGVAFARAIVLAEREASVHTPLTKAQGAMLALEAELGPWVREAGKAQRAPGSSQARLLRLATDVLQARAEEEAEGADPQG